MESEPLPHPRGITVAQTCALLRYSRATVIRMIAAHVLVAWQPNPGKGRKWLVDEVSLMRLQRAQVAAARKAAAPTQHALIQGTLF